MSYIGAEPTTAAFPFDQFSGTGAATSFTLTYAPASATSILVAISGVMQNPNLYSVIGTTLSFSPAPPAGTNNISVLYLGLPVIGSSSPGNTAFMSSTDLTATAGQTVFASAGSYTPGFVQVYRNGARLGNADFTATNGTTITLAVGATAGDLVTIEYYTLTSLTNALPLTGGTVTGSTTFNTGVTINGGLVSGFTGMKNRIINGNMVISQRNNSTSVTPAASAYTLDRWEAGMSAASKFSVQRSTTAPAGFTNSLLATSTSAYTATTSQTFNLTQFIEGFNVADMGFGTASAQTFTLSFQVRSSLTGTFGGAFQNSDRTRSYPFTFTISAANTFETKTVTVAGDTSGTWLTDSGRGLNVIFSLGAGATLSGTSGAWATATYYSATGATSVVGTSGATFYITGVQLERGSNATSFEFIDYGRQLAQCQRYYQLAEGFNGIAAGSGTVMYCTMQFKTEMRANPSVSANANIQITYPGVNDYTQSSPSITISAGRVSTRAIQLNINNFTGLTSLSPLSHNVGINNASVTLSSEL
jgi:hypothetical protein